MTAEPQIRSYEDFKALSIEEVFGAEAQKLFADAANGKSTVLGMDVSPAYVRVQQAQDVLRELTVLVADKSISPEMSEIVLALPLEKANLAAFAALNLKRAAGSGQKPIWRDQFDTILADALNPNSGVE